LNAKFRFSSTLTVLGALAHSCMYGIVAKRFDIFAAQGIDKAAKVSAVV
jgi:hypothetical protein